VWRGQNWELAIFKPEVNHAVELARRLELHQATSVLLWVLSIDVWYQDPVAGTELVDEAIAEARQTGDPATVGVALIASSVAYQRDLRQYSARLLEARKQLGAVGDSYWEAPILNNLACAYVNEADYDSARSLFEQGLDLARPTSDTILTTLLVNLGQVELACDHPEAAGQAFREALEYQVRTGLLDQDSKDLVLGAALCASANSDSERAVYLHGAAEATCAASGVGFEGLAETLATEDRSRLERRLGGKRYEAARVAGMGMTPRQAIEQALLYLQEPAPASTTHHGD
jgi:tetratricopeptide (TPR) repeat protein